MDMEETTQSSNINKHKPLSLNRFIWKISLAIGGLVLLGGAFYSGLIIGKGFSNAPTNYSAPQPNQNLLNLPTQLSADQQSVTNSINQAIRIYPSLNRNFSFYIYPTSSGDKCIYGITDKQGYRYDISRVLGTDKITCSEGEGNLSSSFIGWADGSKFLIEEKEGEIKIVDVEKFKVETYKYDVSKYNFVGANRSLKYWMFRKSQENNISYILLDENKNVALDNINFESNDRGALYDEANDGFLFISRTFTEQNVSVIFDFLSMNTLTLKNILTTEPVGIHGRGCYSEYLISQPGEIILTPGCLTVNSKHIGSDGNIHIKL